MRKVFLLLTMMTICFAAMANGGWEHKKLNGAQTISLLYNEYCNGDNGSGEYSYTWQGGNQKIIYEAVEYALNEEEFDTWVVGLGQQFSFHVKGTCNATGILKTGLVDEQPDAAYWFANSDFASREYFVLAGEQFEADFLYTIKGLASQGFYSNNDGEYYQTKVDKPGLVLSFEFEDYAAAAEFNYGYMSEDVHDVREVEFNFTEFKFEYLGDLSVYTNPYALAIGALGEDGGYIYQGMSYLSYNYRATTSDYFNFRIGGYATQDISELQIALWDATEYATPFPYATNLLSADGDGVLSIAEDIRKGETFEVKGSLPILIPSNQYDNRFQVVLVAQSEYEGAQIILDLTRYDDFTIGADKGYGNPLIQNYSVSLSTYNLYDDWYGGGTVSGDGVYEEGEIATITATPYSGYEFKEWSDGNTDNPRNIIVTSDIELAAYFDEADFRYSINDDGRTVTLTYARRDIEVANIPRTVEIDGTIYTVSKIGKDAFYGENLTSVTIPNTVTTIDCWAFEGCKNLTSITIPNSVTTIGRGAFADCGITSITIPNSVTSIDEYAFGGCDGLVSITVASGNPTYDSRNNCNAIIEKKTNTLIAGCSTTTIPNTVTAIGESAFEDCIGLTSITIPSSVTTIGDYAFDDCANLSSVIFSNGLVSIGDESFSGCNLTSVTIPNSVTSIGEYAFSGNNLTSVTYPQGLDISKACLGFYDNGIFFALINDNEVAVAGVMEDYFESHLGTLVIPSTATGLGKIYSVTSIKEFGGDDYLTSITIPNSVTTIEDYAFYGCKITSITIPNSVTSIGVCAFKYCQDLTSITIPGSVTSIGGGAFNNCYSLTSITCKSKTPIAIPESYISYYADDETGEIYQDTYSTFPTYSYYDEEVTLYIPCDAAVISAYKSDPVWSQLKMQCDQSLQLFTISASANNNAYGSVIGGGDYEYGQNITITAVAKQGCAFKQWSDGSTMNPRTVTVTTDASYIATFEVTGQLVPTTYTVSVMSNNNSYGSVVGGGEYEEGKTATLAAVPENGYQFVNWSDGSTDNPRFVTVTKNESFIAYFKAIQKYTVTLSINNDAYGSVVGDGEYEEGKTATIAAFASSGYKFEKWNDGNTDNPRLITVTKDETFMAYFKVAQSKYTVTLSVNNNSYGTVVGNGEYEEGQTATLVAVASSGYEFEKWSDGNTDNPRVITVTENAMYMANFKVAQSTSAPKYIVTVAANDNSYGSVVGGGEYAEGSSAILVAMPASGYLFDKWNDGNTDNPRTITVSTPMSLVANFIAEPESTLPQYTVTLMPNNNAYGSVMGDGEYAEGTKATLIAVPATGYKFVSWNDGNTENPRIITLSGNVMYMANFEKASNDNLYNTVTAISANDEQGMVVGGGTYGPLATATLAAVPAKGYQFVSWNDGNTDNPREIVVISSCFYVATFEKISTDIFDVEEDAMTVTIVNRQILVNGEAPAFVVTVSGQKIVNANLKAGLYFAVVDGKSVGVVVR